MNTIKVNKDELLKILIANREAHNGIFLQAQQGYREACIKELDAMLEEARAGKRIRRALKLIEPTDQTKEYDASIAMLKMSVEEVIELDESDFRCFVLDEWGWKGQWTTVTQSYVSSGAGTE